MRCARTPPSSWPRQGFAFPFDLNHLSILKYEHLGKEIGFTEVMRMRDELKKRIPVLIEKTETDSPVFLFLPGLLGKTRVAPPLPASTAAPQDEQSLASLMESFKQAKADANESDDWLVVVAVLNRLRKLQPNDPYIAQQLALATYKSKHPDKLQSLQKAKAILEALFPETSCDAETVGLWGAVHKRLWEVGKNAGGPRHRDPRVHPRILHQERLLQRDQLRLPAQRARRERARARRPPPIAFSPGASAAKCWRCAMPCWPAER